MEDEWYQLFEAKFRGSEALIKNRLKIYLPFIKPLFKLYPDGQVLDIGCGRGEWLDLLTDEGIKAVGLDVNVAFTTYCQQKKLTVIEEDALTFLQKQKTDSWLIISAFHVAEHLGFDELQQLIKEAYRVLQPGGLFIVETPNPDNLRVACVTFWFDPTHKRLLPKELLAFLIEQHFYRHKVLGLNESKVNLSDGILCSELGIAVSPDYAIVGQKAGDKIIVHLIDEAFENKYGVTFDEIWECWQNKQRALESRIQELEKGIIIRASNRVIALFKRTNIRKFWKFKRQ